MIAQVFRDLGRTPGLEETVVPQREFLREMTGLLAAGWGGEGEAHRRMRALVGHAVQFETWRSLVGQGLSDREAAVLMAELVACTAGRPGAAGGR